MKRNTLTFFFLILSLNLFALNGFLQTLQNNSPKNNKTLLIFYRPDCPYCINMDKTISADADFKTRLIQKYNVQVLDITSPQGRLMADKFNIHAVPSIVNFDNANGTSNIIKGFGGIEKLSNILGLPSKNNIAEKKQTTNDFSVCGDGIVNGGEQCDDGNLANGDGCTSTCTVQFGFSCSGSPSVCTAVCGDGIVAGGEQCDDGNISNGDGCSATCTVQPGFNCSGNPSICSTVCGDGITAGVEQCDDGNIASNDGCSSTCTFETPPNDDCAGAIILGGTSGIQPGQNITATVSAGVPAGICAGSAVPDVWYRFTLSSQKLCSFALDGPTIADPYITIYSGSCGALVSVVCDDDGGPGTFSLIQTQLNTGTYFIRVSHFNGTSPGTFTLTYNLNLSNICGNNTIENTEECDDGNLVNGDGCSNICKIENAALITGVAINRDSVRANPSAMLDVKSFDKGVLIPRMSTTQRAAIETPAKGLLVFDITTNTFWFYSGSAWTEVGGTSGNAGGGLPAATTSQTLRNNGTNWVANSTLLNDGTTVTVANQIKIAGGVPGAGKVLTSDNTGLATWKDPAAGSVAFHQRLNGSQILVNGGAAVRLLFGSAGNSVFNIGTAYNVSTSEFVAPSSGLYSFTIELSFDPFTPSTLYSTLTEIRVDNTANVQQQTIFFRDVITPGAFGPNLSHTFLLKLNSGDKVYVLSQKNAGGGTSNVTLNGSLGNPTTIFTGYKIN